MRRSVSRAPFGRNAGRAGGGGHQHVPDHVVGLGRKDDAAYETLWFDPRGVQTYSENELISLVAQLDLGP